MFLNIKRVHFVGIGGIGMSGIAEILINKGFFVSGSDTNHSENTDHLIKLGVKIFFEHNSSNIINSDVVVYSSAVDVDTNPETLHAKALHIPVIRRAEMLAEISRFNYCIAVAGTHGKTTTTSMLALILINANIDPTVVVGGRLRDLGGTNARLGNGLWTIVEADEYDRSFLQLTPTISIINNIEEEHLDIYSDYKDLTETFSRFANMTPFYGFIAAGTDSEGVIDILPQLRKKVITFGLNEKADYQAIPHIIPSETTVSSHQFKNTFTVLEYGKDLGEVTLNVPGEFNIKNALATILVARQFGISFDVINNSLTSFTGAFRRFDVKGTKNNITVIDDYAHHPTAIIETLKGLKKHSTRRIIAIFQPHTFTRTRDFYKDFANAFNDADIALITNIYPARETPIPNINGKMIVDEAVTLGYDNFVYADNNEQLLKIIMNKIKPNDIVITMGAGDIWKLANEVFEKL